MVPHLHGASTYQQLRDAGYGPDRIAAMVRRGELIRPRHRLYVNPVREVDERQRGAIGLLAVDGRGTLTGAIALRLQGYAVPVRAHHADIVVPHGTEVPEDLQWTDYRRSSHLALMPLLHAEDMRVAPGWWAFGDLARDVVDQALAETIARAVGARKIDLPALEDSLDRRPRFPGKKRLRRVLGSLRSDLPFSRTEQDVARRLRDAGLQVRLQHRVAVDGGVTYQLDIALPDLRLAIEVDGPHHWLPGQAEADRIRDRSLRALDWLVERFSVYEIDRDPEAFVAAVLQLVERRRIQLMGRR